MDDGVPYDDYKPEELSSFDKIPISALSRTSRNKLSKLLNPETILLSEDGYQRDWRGFFKLSGISLNEYENISREKDKMNKILDLCISQQHKANGTILNFEQFLKCLRIIDRYDVHDDINENIVEDSKAYIKRKIKKGMNDDQAEQISYTEPEKYDAVVLYHENDAEFVAQLIERCEQEMGYKLFCKERDMEPGVPIESVEMLNIISNQCERIIVVISKSFLESNTYIFISNYAQSLGIQKNNFKIIPCLLEPCQNLPQMLTYCFRLEYYRNSPLTNFWDKLDRSIGGPRYRQTQTLNSPDNENVKLTTPPMESETKVIFPPAIPLRPASSMLTIPEKNSNHDKMTKSLSKSSFYLSEAQDEISSKGMKDFHKKKWYNKFLPPKPRKLNLKTIDGEENKPTKVKFWSKKKKEKKKQLELVPA